MPHLNHTFSEVRHNGMEAVVEVQWTSGTPKPHTFSSTNHHNPALSGNARLIDKQRPPKFSGKEL
jgi:hypothetical protein